MGSQHRVFCSVTTIEAMRRIATNKEDNHPHNVPGSNWTRTSKIKWGKGHKHTSTIELFIVTLPQIFIFEELETSDILALVTVSLTNADSVSLTTTTARRLNKFRIRLVHSCFN